MKTTKLLIVLILLSSIEIQCIYAQIASASDNLVVVPIADRKVPFNLSANGISKTIEFGPDLAWADMQNFRRNILFMGLDQIDIVRASFQPTYPLVNGTDLTTEQINDLNNRLSLINTYVGPNINLALNCDHPWVDNWYVGNPERWEQLIRTTAQKFIDAGHSIVTIGAFNEPDYGWGQGSAQDMYDITNLMNNNSFYDAIRLSGGNTLNCDEAQGWYDYLVPAGVDEGNTHQLAGSFNGFASFLQNVRANGHHATLDELHNIVEALVGYEYGMQTGIWWADIDLASGEMVKAFDGERLGYAEHRSNWTAAAVYRNPEGKVQAFGGTSERQAVTTTYNYLSKDRVVYYDGYGPQRSFVLELPGGTGYGQGQTNAERVINISWGDDIQPVINGTYKLVNRATGQVLEVAGDFNEAGVYQGNYSGKLTQQWEVFPVDSRVGGDFSYYRIKPVSSANRRLDLYGYSLETGGKVSIWDDGPYGNQQWYLDYAEDGWFYIRSRESSYCAEINGSGNLVQGEKSNSQNQQWRFLPVDAPIEFDAPSIPTNLVAESRPTSVKLSWSASPESDVLGYDILRSQTMGGAYNTISRSVVTTEFVDNTVLAGETYFYVIKAVDQSLNQSNFSNEVTTSVNGANDMVVRLNLDSDTKDSTVNLNHAAINGGSFVSGINGEGAVSLNGSSDFMQLSSDIVSYEELTISTWVKWAGFNVGQYLFEFSNGSDEYFYLSPSISGFTEFAIKHNGVEQKLNAAALPAGEWAHVAITIGDLGMFLYINGQVVAQSEIASIRPIDIMPFLNYLGVNTGNEKYFEGLVDDFRIYNYQMTPGTVGAIYNALSVEDDKLIANKINLWPVPADDFLNITTSEKSHLANYKLFLYSLNGKLLIEKQSHFSNNIQLDVSGLTSGLYILKMTSDTGNITKKIIVNH